MTVLTPFPMSDFGVATIPWNCQNRVGKKNFIFRNGLIVQDTLKWGVDVVGRAYSPLPCFAMPPLQEHVRTLLHTCSLTHFTPPKNAIKLWQSKSTSTWHHSLGLTLKGLGSPIWVRQTRRGRESARALVALLQLLCSERAAASGATIRGLHCQARASGEATTSDRHKLS